MLLSNKGMCPFAIKKITTAERRAGLTIGQTGQMPGASRLNTNTLLYWFFMFLGRSTRVKIVELFDYCV